MEFEGKVLQIFPLQSGTSARGPWQRQDVLFEMPQEFSRKLCVKFFNRPDDVARLKVGELYTVSVNVESREYNGRWYTEVNAWRVQGKQPQATPEAAPVPDMGSYSEAPVSSPAPAFTAPAPEVDDMPF